MLSERNFVNLISDDEENKETLNENERNKELIYPIENIPIYQTDALQKEKENTSKLDFNIFLVNFIITNFI